MARGTQGFTVVEALVAAGVLATAVVAVVQVFMIGSTAVAEAGHTTVETLLASQKLQQLTSLTWAFARDGQRIDDSTTDTTVWPDRAAGGTGLAVSPADALDRDTPGYVDYVDRGGQPTGAAEATYTRRWSISPGAIEAADTVVIEVLVARRALLARLGQVPARRRIPGMVRLVRLRARRLS